MPLSVAQPATDCPQSAFRSSTPCDIPQSHSDASRLSPPAWPLSPSGTANWSAAPNGSGHPPGPGPPPWPLQCSPCAAQQGLPAATVPVGALCTTALLAPPCDGREPFERAWACRSSCPASPVVAENA